MVQGTAAAKMNRALIQSSEGAKMIVVEAPTPTPRRGEVLVRVHTSAVNEMDVQVRGGGWAKSVKAFKARGPVTTGFEFAGVALSDGPAIRAGDPVIGYSHVLSGVRTHAERICVPARTLQVIPSHWSMQEAAALVSMGLTSIEIFERIRPLQAGQKALVIGAAGGVGVYAVQMAKHQGAHVTAVCSAANASWIRSQGADVVRAYETEEAFSAGDRMDLVVDAPMHASFARSAPFLAKGGTYVATNPTADIAGFAQAALSPHRAGYLMMLSTTPAKMTRLIQLVVAGALRPAIDSVYGLHQADAAFDRFSTRGKQGRVILDLSGS